MNKTVLKKRLIIGSANFTQKYGLSTTKINHDEIRKILDLAKENSIYKIDTAQAYLKKKIFLKILIKNLNFLQK